MSNTASQDNPQNHDKVDGPVDVDKPSQAEGDVGDDNSTTVTEATSAE